MSSCSPQCAQAGACSWMCAPGSGPPSLWKPQGATGLEHKQHQFHQEAILTERFVVLRQDLSAHSTAWLRHSYCTTKAKLNQTGNKQDGNSSFPIISSSTACFGMNISSDLMLWNRSLVWSSLAHPMDTQIHADNTDISYKHILTIPYRQMSVWGLNRICQAHRNKKTQHLFPS